LDLQLGWLWGFKKVVVLGGALNCRKIRSDLVIGPAEDEKTN
jgi:hypothetical protein